MIRVKDEAMGVAAGNRYGSVVVIGHPFSIGKGKWAVVCRCDCGNLFAPQCGNLVQVTKRTGDYACGCRAHTGNSRRSHGESGTALYRQWKTIRRRCNDPGFISYPWYGARGIKVCDEWQTYENYRDFAVANGYQPGLTFDRKDSSHDYSPDNFRDFCEQRENAKRSWDGPQTIERTRHGRDSATGRFVKETTR